jgi:hypothetical protein
MGIACCKLRYFHGLMYRYGGWGDTESLIQLGLFQIRQNPKLLKTHILLLTEDVLRRLLYITINDT